MRREGRSNCRADARQALRNSGTSEPTPGNQISRPSASALKQSYLPSLLASFHTTMFTWLGTAALLPDSLLSNHPHRIGIYRRAVHAPVNHINPHQNERNTQQLSHIQQHTLLESLLIQLDELDKKTSQENPDQPHAEHHAPDDAGPGHVRNRASKGFRKSPGSITLRKAGSGVARGWSRWETFG